MAREERGRLARRWKARATACLAAPEASLPLDSLRREPRRRHLTSPCQNPAAAACLRRLRTPATAACLRRAGNPRPPPVSPHKGAGRPAAAGPAGHRLALLRRYRARQRPATASSIRRVGWRWEGVAVAALLDGEVEGDEAAGKSSAEGHRQTEPEHRRWVNRDGAANREDEWEAVGVKCWSKRLFD
ncbi:hypothetical protein OsJ_14351 [Oryza sativa Japonica Group]|uniref:Uncharacterized protein n=1 Tax=Oryza sativa subsp. japonica TaxID=39947 RepID=A3ASL6_ORYSJ|nr:hypothetical protein OsJ_14351 [Oryza sativa Japonica Group]